MKLLNEDVINVIFMYLNNPDSYSLSLSCKYIYETTKKRGFAKFIMHDYSKWDMNVFMKRYIRHHGTVTTFVIKYTNNPFYWLPKWTHRIQFEFCKIKDVIDPPAVTETEELSIISNHDWTIHINFKKFPKLKKLKVKGYTLNFKGIDECQQMSYMIYEPIDDSCYNQKMRLWVNKKYRV
jgi:hypothetical protein